MKHDGYDWTKLILDILKFLKPIILFILRWLRKALPYVLTGTIAGGGTWYASQAKHDEIASQKASQPKIIYYKPKSVPTKIIEQKIDYTKIRAMIKQAIKEHEDKYHR